MSELPVQQMILYKHGVGFYVRQGDVSGDQIALTFRKDEINDVLKSLAVIDRAGGQVLGIYYQTPMDREARLASSSIILSDTASLRDLLRDLRGRSVRLDFETTPGTIETVSGRLIGQDERTTEESDETRVGVLADSGEVRVFRFDMLRALRIKDQQSQQDLGFFLDTSMSEDDRRVVNIRLSEGDHDVVVYYVAPSPTWRVSYRLVAEWDADGSTGKALLQGWGLFDNRLEEDLDQVQVTLVAGQPISFIYELYASHIPQRPKVEDKSRIAPGPIQFEAERFASPPPMPSPAPKRAAFRMMQDAVPDAALSMDDTAASTLIATESQQRGEVFEYKVNTPVSVRRGESALVPIIGSEIRYERELLYNKSKLADHPVAALHFENNTGLTLENGPVTVVEDGDYKGEAVIPFTGDKNPVYIPYAVELGIVITETPSSSIETRGIIIDNGLLVFEEYQLWHMVYHIENKTDRERTVTLEAATNPRAELFDTPTPDVETPSLRRWRVPVAAGSRTSFTFQERAPRRRTEQISKLKYRQLQNYLQNRWLDQDTFNSLSDILVQFALIEQTKKQQNKLTADRKTIYEQQEQIRANLAALQPTGDEAALRNRLLKKLEYAQDRLDTIDVELDDAQKTLQETEATVEKLIAALGKSD